MRLLLSGSHGDVEPMVGLAVQLGLLRAEVRVCGPLDCVELPAHAAEECDAQVGTGVMPTGVCR
jgi:vancomycin aglycone glucosyltransferase